MSTNITKIPLSKLVESPLNPRQQYDEEKLAELAASLKGAGQQQPIKVREVDGKFEIVFGHRRFRAAKLAKLESLDAQVVPMSDDAVALAQIVENGQREDVSPLEEADSYATLRDRFKKSADDIAALIGKSKSHVYARLKLTALKDAGRKALIAGKILPETALLIARVPTEKLQAKAVKDLTVDWRYEGGATFRDAAEWIQRHFMLQLADAPFDQKDADLVPEAGACKACPKRTGNIPAELRADVKGADICTDPECFRAKLDVHAKLVLEAAKGEGLTILPASEAKDLFQAGSRYIDPTKGWVDVQDANPNDPKRRTWEAILGKHLPKPSLARDPDGYVRKLVEEDTLRKAMKDTGYGQPSPKEQAAKEEERKEAKEEREAKNFRKANVETIHAHVLKRADKVSDLTMMRLLLEEQPWSVVDSIGKRHEVETKGWIKYVGGLRADACKSLLLECIVESHTQAYVREGLSKGFRETLAAMGIDLAGTEKETKEAAKEAEKAVVAAKAEKPGKGAKGPLARKLKE